MGKTPAAVPETDKHAEMVKETLEEGKEFFDQELEDLQDPAFEAEMAEFMSAEKSTKGKEKLLRSMRSEYYRNLSEKRKQVLRERKEAAMRGVIIELDEEMKSELKKFIRSNWEKYRAQDLREIDQLGASMDHIKEQQKQRRKQDSVEAKANAKTAKKAEDALQKALNKHVPGRTPKSKSSCCTLQ